jgi:hypothetical protein
MCVRRALYECGRGSRGCSARERAGSAVGFLPVNESPKGPNLPRAVLSILRAARRRPPAPAGTARFDHAVFGPILEALATQGVSSLQNLRTELEVYRISLRLQDPDDLSRDEALAFWINLYNAEVLELVAEARELGRDSVFRLPGAFDRSRIAVAGETLSPDDIEHGKVRRFADPRIHAALVCGSASCPTLRPEPYAGDRLHDQLEEQMTRFMDAGGYLSDRAAGEVRLSRIFLWYGADFARPQSMPSLRPVSRSAVMRSLVKWLAAEEAAWVEDARPRILFRPYDWSFACSVG